MDGAGVSYDVGTRSSAVSFGFTFRVWVVRESGIRVRMKSWVMECRLGTGLRNDAVGRRWEGATVVGR